MGAEPLKIVTGSDLEERIDRLAVVAAAKESEEDLQIAARLARKFGYGDKPSSRQAFYHRCALAVKKHGDAAMLELKEAAQDAINSDCPGRYFAKSAKRRLLAKNLWPGLECVDRLF